MFGPLILRYTGSQNLSVCVTRNGSMIRRDLLLAQRHIPADNSGRPAVLFCLHRKQHGTVKYGIFCQRTWPETDGGGS